jgi:ABC-2 type transport system ATP-binding protein
MTRPPGHAAWGGFQVCVSTETRSLVDWAIRTEHLTKIYGGNVIAVNDMDLKVPKGSVYGLLGPNGAGKTTTLKLLLGLQRPTAGRAHVFDTPCSPNSVAARRMIGYLPTHPKLPGNLKPVEYLDLLGQLCRLPAEIRRPRLTSLLRAVGLLGATNQRISTFSTGMCTRLGIAASLVADPPLLLWDEPTAGLDPAARRFTLDLIRELAKTRTILVATHILSDIDQICDHVGVMHEGKMIFSGPMREMTRRLPRDSVRLNLDGPPEDVQQLAAQVDALPGVRAQMRDAHTMIVEVADGHSQAGTLAEVLQRVDAAQITLLSVHTAQHETENAYLQILQEDEAHGFQRFDLVAGSADDADTGDVPA